MSSLDYISFFIIFLQYSKLKSDYTIGCQTSGNSGSMLKAGVVLLAKKNAPKGRNILYTWRSILKI
jgi:hypothetical protein